MYVKIWLELRKNQHVHEPGIVAYISAHLPVLAPTVIRAIIIGTLRRAYVSS